MSAPTDPPTNWKRPPVAELAISVQFAPVEGLTSAHVGLFWKLLPGTDWVTVQEAVALDDQFEKFGEKWVLQGLQFSAVERLQARIQIVNAGDDRIVQVQNSRFIYNWRKRGGEYPSFEGTYREFLGHLRSFEGFLRDAGLGEVRPNQWELTYVDQMPRGEQWETPADFHDVLPGLFARPSLSKTVALETAHGEQHFEIVPKRGRLHLVGRHGRVSGETEALILTTTARGPVDPSRPGFDLDAGLRLGHSAIRESFRAVASEKAFKYWEGD